MRIKSLHIEGFRSIVELDIEFERGITTLLGENATGKSTIVLALSRLTSQLQEPQGDAIKQEDYPYFVIDELSIRAEIQLSSLERLRGLVQPILGGDNAFPRKTLLSKLGDPPRSILVELSRPTPIDALITWGNLSVRADLISIYGEANRQPADSWHGVLSSPDLLNEISEANNAPYGPYNLDRNALPPIGDLLADGIKKFDEFRVRERGEDRLDSI